MSSENLVTNIVPSKPFKNYADIAVLAAQGKGRVARIQVDICDGEFVKNVSWPFTETSKNIFADLYKKQENGEELDIFMPEAYDISYTADLMCKNPEKFIDTLVAYGFDEIIVHWRSLTPPNLTLTEEEKVPFQLEMILETCTKSDLKLYLGVDIKTNLEEVKNFFKKYANIYIQLRGVQVMGIENIGLQGQEFVKKSLDIVKEFRKFFDQEFVYDNKEIKWEEDRYFQILFDGGINEENLQDIKGAGADVFCVGHFLTDGDFVSNLKIIKNTLK